VEYISLTLLYEENENIGYPFVYLSPELSSGSSLLRYSIPA
jgi:hypothetical protein